MKTFYLIYLLGIFLPSNARKIINEKIVNGEDAVLGQFPYQVLWAMESNGAFYVNCGGSIYNKSTIITAGHCCVHFDHYPLSKTKIIAGQIEVSGSYGQVIEIDSYLIHPDYDQEDNNNNWNDVCLLTLKTDLEYNDNVKCIKLNDRSLEPGTKCIVSGWGRLEAEGGKPDILQFVELNLMDQLICDVAFPDDAFNFGIDGEEICAYDEGKSPCYGDSGGPLACDNTLTGIVSWGLDCDGPGVFTNVEHYVDWIGSNNGCEE